MTWKIAGVPSGKWHWARAVALVPAAFVSNCNIFIGNPIKENMKMNDYIMNEPLFMSGRFTKFLITMFAFITAFAFFSIDNGVYNA